MKENIIKEILIYSTVITEMSMLIAGGIVAGFYIDRWLGTGPGFLIIGLTAGIFSGIRIFLYVCKKFLEGKKNGA